MCDGVEFRRKSRKKRAGVGEDGAAAIQVSELVTILYHYLYHYPIP